MPRLYLQACCAMLVSDVVHRHHGWDGCWLLPPLEACMGPSSTMRARRFTCDFLSFLSFPLFFPPSISHALLLLVHLSCDHNLQSCVMLLTYLCSRLPLGTLPGMSSQQRAGSPFLSSHQLPIALHLGEWPCDNSPFTWAIPVGIVVSQVLFRQPCC